MKGCWSRSAAGPRDTQCSDRSPALQSPFPHRTLWGSVGVVLLLLAIAVSAMVLLGVKRKHPQSVLQVVRVTLEEQSGVLLNHSALVDRCHEVVTYYVTSHTNLTSAVLFDMKNGLICYKPESRDACFLQKMETSDFENVHTLLNMSQHKVNHFWLPGNKTRWQTEFLGVLGGSGVDAMTLEEPLQALCQHGPIYWARRADGPGKQRLIYFCIDICFPSNVCVSVCFYYLPE
ncbi:BRICHOS domain-containing protein 5 [Lepisosteus oculatus]|uniref:BRICHOS domain-containing protein 5 n=1 Tax=Lepisosteus oculatus TaxID=7918 RepID=UPI0035F527A7